MITNHQRKDFKVNMLKSGRQKNKTRVLIYPTLFLALFLAAALATSIGAVSFNLREVGGIVLELFGLPGRMNIDPVRKDILLQLRMPRVILAGLVGASLATAGAAFQGLFRNPMADSYVIGVSSGAALGAVAAMLIGLPAAWGGIGAVPLFAFIGGMLTLVLVYRMARVGNEVPVMPLLLAGIAISAFLSALVSLLTYFADDKIHQVVFWIMGGLGGATWMKIKIMVPYALLGFGCIYFYHRELNAMLFGEETAHHLGIDIEKVKIILLAGSSLLVAAAVATSGIIGFVGLVVPHFIRLLIGPDHRHLLPASALLGAGLLIITDALARTIITPRELPVGIITALLGAPLFVYLLRKRKKLRYFNLTE